MRDAGLVAIGIVKGRLRQMHFEKVLGCIQVWDESDVSWMHGVTRVDCCWMASCVRCKTSSKLPRRSLKPLLRSSRRAFSPGPCSVRCFMSPFYTTWCAGELENQPFPQESGGGSRRNFFTRPVGIFFGCGRSVLVWFGWHEGHLARKTCATEEAERQISTDDTCMLSKLSINSERMGDASPIYYLGFTYGESPTVNPCFLLCGHDT